MSVTTPRWQLLLLTVLIVGLGGIFWWRLQPPPLPASRLPIAPERATLNHPLRSTLLPDVTFEYPASRERANVDRFEYGGYCTEHQEAFFWETRKVLEFAGAPPEITNFQISYDSVKQAQQRPLIDKQNVYLTKSLSKVIQRFYKRLAARVTDLSLTSQPLPDGGSVKTWGDNETGAFFTYHGKQYSSFFDSTPSGNGEIMALGICQLLAETPTAATPTEPLYSSLIPGVSFAYPAVRVEPEGGLVGGRINSQKVSYRTCEQYTWTYGPPKDYSGGIEEFYKQIRNLGAKITNFTPIFLSSPALGQKQSGLRIDGQRSYIEFLLKSKLYAGITSSLSNINIMICSSDAISSK